MNKYPQYIIDKAIQLRTQKQMTVPEIAEHLQIAKSTIHEWLKAYPLPARTQRQNDAQVRGTASMKAQYQALRETAYQEAWDEAETKLGDPHFRDFVVLYLAEGYKRDRHVVEIVNSDATVMRLAHYFCLQLRQPNNAIMYRVQIHEDHDEGQIKVYWATILGIPSHTIHVMRKSNSGKLKGRHFRSVYGVLSIRMNDTYFHAKLQAWMDFLRKEWVDISNNC